MGEGKNPTSEHLLALAKKYGIKKASVIIDEMRDVVLSWSTFAKEAEVPQKSWESIEKSFRTLG